MQLEELGPPPQVPSSRRVLSLAQHLEAGAASGFATQRERYTCLPGSGCRKSSAAINRLGKALALPAASSRALEISEGVLEVGGQVEMSALV